MYRGYSLDSKDLNIFNEYYREGFKAYDDQKHKFKLTLDNYLGPQGTISASKLIEDWFPSVEADVFLSHSHKDEKLAIGLACWMNQQFGLNVFIDSCIWGHAESLLRAIDDKYCYESESGVYSYEKRNYSTAHVYTMLSTALYEMIDKAEALFFLHTPNSVTARDVVNSCSSTNSSWVYAEISATKTIRRRTPQEHRGNIKTALAKSEVMNEHLELNYNLELNHLTNLDLVDLAKWGEKASDYDYPLDYLYRLKNK